MLKIIKQKKVLGLVLSLLLCLSMNVPTFAAERTAPEVISDTSKTVQPRIGIAGYTNHYHASGSYSGDFYISCNPNLTMNQFTIETSGFNSGTTISIEIFAEDNFQMNYVYTVTGNTKKENISLRWPLTKQTYRVHYYVGNGGPGSTPVSNDDGWIGVWLY